MKHGVILLQLVLLFGPAATTAGWSAPMPIEEIPADQTVSFLDSQVQRADHSVIGRTINLLVKNGVPQAAIIDLSGFMGVGNHNAVVPWQDLSFDPAANPVQVTVDLTADQMRAIVKSRSSDSGSAAPPTSGSTLTASDGASKLIDASLLGADGKMLGTLTDALVDHAGKPRAVIVSLGGTLDPGAREIAVVWSCVRFAEVKGQMSVSADLTQDQADAAETYKSDKPAVALKPPLAAGDQPAAHAE